MKFAPTALPGVVVVEPRVFRDERGFFLESYQAEKFKAGGLDVRFVQDNHAASSRGVLRGLHLQLKRPQGKLVRVVEGAIWDVAVDIRRDSPYFKKWVAVELSADNFKQLYVPAGFAHGYCVLSARAQVEYKVTEFYDAKSEISVLYNDPEIAVPWPVKDPILSPRDVAGRPLSCLSDILPVCAAQ
ncbi:MAG: dTDP-4-dehydrorhamnose 3,5-epimerase [Elusimicrobiota bacterium]|jgi:dTDP-4-dehydrorhamnose 3,5-epimerase